MTETAPITLAALGVGPDYINQTIWLPQLILEAARAGQAAIRGRTFTNCTLEGPAVLLAVEGCDFQGCYMGDIDDDPNGLLLKPLGTTRVTGAVAFHGCHFVNCNFRGIGFTGTDDFLQDLVDSFAGAPS